MKKIILALLVVLSLSGCSKDEVTTKMIYTNKIVGNWESIFVKIKNNTTNVVTNITPECPTLFSFTGASSESNLSTTLITGGHSLKFSSKVNNVCTVQNNYNFTWTDIGNGVYTLRNTTDTNIDVYSIVYSDNDKTMTLTQQDGSNFLITYTLIKK